ncbi:MAG: nucleotidyltransferase substrate binding protein [Elusimicrobia bacterium]|nr:nucleotidyltransferase substrate binding protein [Elusimicrobiota bacterium]
MERAEERIALELGVLKKALATLKDVIQNPSQDLVRDRDAAIQRFEYTFELAWKSMKLLGEREGLACPGPRSAVKSAFKLGHVDSIEDWLAMLKARNQTSHTYHEETAVKVYECVVRFPPLVEAFLEKAAAGLNS